MCLSWEFDVLLVGQDGRGSAGTSADWTTDQSAFATAGERTDEHASSGAATDHQQVAPLVAFAGAVKRPGMDGIACAIHPNAVESEPQVRLSLDSSTMVRFHNNATDAGALGNHSVSIDDDRLRNGRCEAVTDFGSVCRDRLIENHLDRRVLRQGRTVTTACAHLGRDAQSERQRQRCEASDHTVGAFGKLHEHLHEFRTQCFCQRMPF